MRISDWSSDVCSSDLIEDRAVQMLRQYGKRAQAMARLAGEIILGIDPDGGDRGQTAIGHVDRHGRAASQPRVLEIAHHGLMLTLKWTLQYAGIIRKMRPDKGDGAVQADLLHRIDAVIALAAPQ